MAEVDSIMPTLTRYLYGDPKCLIKAFEMLQILTSNLNMIDNRSVCENRKLFNAANSALYILTECIATRLEIPTTEATIDLAEQMEQNLRTFRFADLSFPNDWVTSKANNISEQYNAIIQKALGNNSDLGEMQNLMRLALGDEVNGLDDPVIRQSQLIEMFRANFAEQEWNRYRDRMYRISLRLVIVMATAISKQFKGQALHVLGTAFPASAFA